MNRIVNQFIKAFKVANERKWDRIYVAVDIHETTLEPTWSEEMSATYYAYAQKALQLMSDHKMVCLILWSCGKPNLNKEYLEFFKKDGINFDYTNENPECKSTKYADFNSKLYFSVGLDDKFGFIPEEDWLEIYEYFYKLRFTEIPFEDLGKRNPITNCQYLDRFSSEVVNELRALNIPNFTLEDSKAYISYEKDGVNGLIAVPDKGGYFVLHNGDSYHSWSVDAVFYKTNTIDGISEILKMKGVI